MNFKKIGLALAVSAAAASANAAWESGSLNTPDTNGELVLTVWNKSTFTSFTQDLGVYTDEALGMTVGTSFALDTDGLAYVGGAGAASDLMWNVAGSNNNQADLFTTLDPKDYSFYLTQTATPTGTHAFATMGTFFNSMAVYENQLNTNGTFSATSNAADPTVLLSGQQDYAGADSRWGTTAAGLSGNFGVVDSATDANSSLYAFAFQPNANFTGGDTLQSAAQWSLDLTSGQLNYGSVAAVPVPAAVWMFASGLVGLAGIARRKKA